MLHEKTVERATLDLIRRLSADKALRDFVLVGGTALSLQLGHRKSIDIDLFTNKAFDPKALANHLNAQYKAENTTVLGNAVFTWLEGVKTDLLAHQYPWIRPHTEAGGVRMASMEDIAAMKLHAIVQSGSRLKDYVDVFLLLERNSLDQMVAAYTAKYNDGSPTVAKNALLYHHEIDFGKGVEMINRQMRWPEISKRLKEAVVEPKKIFQGENIGERKDQSKGLGRGRKR